MKKGDNLKEIKKIGLMSLGRISALFGILYGLFNAIIILTGLVPPEILSKLPPIQTTGWSLLYFPITFGIVSFLGGIIVASLYNLFAKLVGGMRLEI